jgi:hypothetical protein
MCNLLKTCLLVVLIIVAASEAKPATADEVQHYDESRFIGKMKGIFL